MHSAVGELVGGDAAEDDLRVGNGGTEAPAAAGGPGVGTGAFGADAEKAAFVDASDPAPAPTM